MGECFKCRSNRKKSNPLTYAYSPSNKCIESKVTVDGVEYTQLTLTGSGTLTVNREIEADVWLCGGGGKGSAATGDNSTGRSGGGGSSGYAVQQSIVLSDAIVAEIGAASGQTKFGSISANGGKNASYSNGSDGGAGGGAGVTIYDTGIENEDGYYIHKWSSGGVGQGSGANQNLGTPFNVSVSDYNFGGSLGSGGGGARLGYDLGEFNYYNETAWRGGDGSSYGGNGKSASYSDSTATINGVSASGGTGYGGGGIGGSTYTYSNKHNGGKATWYGCGGGGGGFAKGTLGTGGSGYQGVIYIRWKTADAV